MDKKGRVSYSHTDMLIHVVNNQTNTILDVERLFFYSPLSSVIIQVLIIQVLIIMTRNRAV